MKKLNNITQTEFAKGMSRNFNPTVLLLLAVTTIFSMYQETPAQKKRAVEPKSQLSATQSAAPEIAYTVSMTKPWTHLLEVEMSLKLAGRPDSIELKMPVWTPGSYLVREYARHVQDLAVKSASGGTLAWRKTNKNTWQVDTKGVKEIVVSYSVYSNELTVRTNELNDDHAFWNNSALLLFPKDQLKSLSTITVKPHGNWKVATGLPKVNGQANTFHATNFDVLYDSPFEVSDFKETSFDVRGKKHRIVMSGDGNYDLKQMAVDFAKIVGESAKIFGDIDYDDYTFIVNLRGGGGLEHLNSTALQWNRFGFKPEARYRDFLGLVAHEYFHSYNVKRIRPDALGPFDYENENYTKLLWVAEGGTEYYSNLLLQRAGLLTAKEFLDGKASAIEQLQARPGRFETSLEEASFDAWIKYYRQDENAINNQISYYDKGEIVSMMLDLTIRKESGGAKSLDDVMRYLYTEFFKKNKNFTPEDFQKASELMAGKSLDDFFTRYVRGEAEIDFNSIVGGIGLELAATERNKTRAYLGADTTEENGRLTIRSIAANTPAYEQGLNTGDQIVAIDGYRATQTFMQSYLGEKKPNDKVKLTLFRFDKMREVMFALGTDQRKDYAFSPVNNPKSQQKRLYKGYMNTELQ